ncbi:MAG TPA: Gfo/Idh/MocA family oxidoreductase [Casimicrobiaceae bacterium]|nr:Gfo/Idh/MocA family oxidoreductase [Casimicrobiaceae bacterium]
MGTASSPLRLAIIGCGLAVEQCHLPALRKIAGLELVALVDSDLARLNRIADRAGVRRRHTDYRAMLNDAGVDLIAVCAPPHLHAEIGLAVVDAGKHLFMEKPLALSLHDADRLVERTTAAGAKALIGFNLRWHRLIRRASSIIDAGGLGQLATIHTTFTSASGFRREDSAWRQRQDWGAGVLFDLGIHHFDLWRFLVGCEVEELFAHRRSDGPGHERATVCAMMANGVLVTSAFSHGVSDTNELEICGAKASLRLSCYRSDSLRVYENGAPRGAVRHWPGDAVRVLRNVPQAFARLLDGGDVIVSYRAQWQHIVDAIRSGAPIKPSLEEGRSALQIALAAAQSARSGRPVRVAQAAGAIAPLATAAPGTSAAG